MEAKMFDKSGLWIQLETYEDFDNGLSDLIDLWSSQATKSVKESALAHFKEDLEAAAIQWVDNRAKSKKYAAIGDELAEFEAVLKDDPDDATKAGDKALGAPAKAKRKA